MAWTVGNSQNLGNNASATSATITAPTGIVNGNLIILVLGVDTTTTTDPGVPTWPAGFTQITSHFTAPAFNGGVRLSWAYKIAASESGNYTVTWPNAGIFSWGSVVISGNSGTPLDASATNNSTTNTTSIVAPSVNAAATGELLLCLFSNSGGQNPYTMPAGMTTIFNNNIPNGNGVFLGMSYLALGASGATGTNTTTASFADIAEAASAVFNPASGGGGGTTPTPRTHYPKPVLPWFMV